MAAIGALTYFGWANRHPKRPTDLPATSIWVRGPSAPLDTSPRGVWIGCWINKATKLNHCRVTDYEGIIEFEDDFVPKSGDGAIAYEQLILKPVDTMDLWTWVEQHQREVPQIQLKNGVILVPVSEVNAFRNGKNRRTSSVGP